MLSINRIISYIDYPRLKLSWSLNTDLSQIYAWIYRSYGTPDMTLITKLPIISSADFTDYSVPSQSHYSPVVYKIKFVDARAGLDPDYAGTEYEYVESDYVGFYTQLSNHDYRIYNEIVRKNRLRLNSNYEGVVTYLYKKKPYGTLCSKCGDATTKLSTDSTCTTCFGTGIEGGYYTPFTLSTANFIETSKIGRKKGPTGPLVPNTYNVEICPPPILDTSDVLYRPDSDETYYILSSSLYRYKQSMPTGQTLEVGLLQRDSVLYKLPKIIE